MVIYKQPGGTLAFVTAHRSASGETWSAPAPVHASIATQAAASEPTVVELDNVLLLEVPTVGSGGLDEFRFDAAGGRWLPLGPATDDQGSPLSLWTGTGMGLAAGFESGSGRAIFGVFAQPDSATFSPLLRLARRDAT